MEEPAESEQLQLFAVETKASALPDPTTTVLLGAYIAMLRTGRAVSMEAVASGQSRTLQWFEAVERGEVGLNDAALDDVEKALDDRGVVVDLYSVLADLQKRPFGREASNLRTALLLSGWEGGDSPSNLESDDVSFANEVVAPEQRALVLAPVALFLGIVVALAEFVRWSKEIGSVEDSGGVQETVRRSIELLTGTSVYVSLIALLITAAAPALIDLRIGQVTSWVRGAKRSEQMNIAAELVRLAGLKWSAGSWRSFPFKPFLLPRYRANVEKAGLRADMFERLSFVCVVSAPLCAATAIWAAPDDGFRLEDLVPAAGALILALGAVTMALRATRSGKIFAAEISRGLGWDLEYARNSSGLDHRVGY